MTDIVQFIRDRLDEDEALAREASAFYDDDQTNGVPWNGHEGVDLNGHERYWIAPHLGVVNHVASGRHIARHDPARVLREVEAKRRILARHYADDDGSCVGCHFANDETRWAETITDCPELRDMASVYADHPDYEQSWSVE